MINNHLKTRKNLPRKQEPELTVPFKEGTDKHNVAKALLAGETDRKKLVRELGVGINTIYNVTTELTANGYAARAIHEKKRIPPHNLTTSTSQPKQPRTSISGLSPEQTAQL